jgi:hypothetical protein
MNESGMVINFSLTRSESLKEVEVMLKKVKEQCSEVEFIITGTYTKGLYPVHIQKYAHLCDNGDDTFSFASVP